MEDTGCAGYERVLLVRCSATSDACHCGGSHLAAWATFGAVYNARSRIHSLLRIAACPKYDVYSLYILTKMKKERIIRNKTENVDHRKGNIYRRPGVAVSREERQDFKRGIYNDVEKNET